MILSAPLAAEAANPAGPGGVNFVRNTVSPDFTDFLRASNHTPSLRSFMHSHYEGLRGYDPFYENQTFLDNPSWNPPRSQVYQDLYILHSNDPVDQQAIANESWLLHSGPSPSGSNRIYVDASCSVGCPAYAGDISNPSYRSWWINNKVRPILQRGYEGLFLDDANMELRTFEFSNGSTVPSSSIYQGNGTQVTQANSRLAVAAFVEAIDGAFPNKEIIANNNQFWIGNDAQGANKRTIKAADFTELERGYSIGTTGGAQPFGFETLLNHVNWIHSLGGSVLLEPTIISQSSAAEQPLYAELELASYFLGRARSDALSSDWRANPNNWWHGWDTNLGGPLGKYYRWPEGGDPLFRRDFAGGLVLVNDPQSPTRVVSLPDNDVWRDLNGNKVQSVSLPARRGKVLLRRIKTKVRQKVRCEVKNGKPKLRLKGKVVDRSGARISPPFPRKLKLEIQRKGGSWNKVGGGKARLKRKAKFAKRIDVGSATGKYRVRTKFKGNERYFPARSRFKDCSY